MYSVSHRFIAAIKFVSIVFLGTAAHMTYAIAGTTMKRNEEFLLQANTLALTKQPFTVSLFEKIFHAKFEKQSCFDTVSSSNEKQRRCKFRANLQPTDFSVNVEADVMEDLTSRQSFGTINLTFDAKAVCVSVQKLSTIVKQAPQKVPMPPREPFDTDQSGLMLEGFRYSFPDTTMFVLAGNNCIARIIVGK